MMRGSDGASALGEASMADVIEFDVQDVTNTRRARVRGVQRSAPAGAVAKTLAARMGLANHLVPWTLRLDSSSTFLDDMRPIGEQIRPGAKATLTPKTHLG